VFDALRAGFGRVVFVIREEFANEFRARIAAKYADRVPVDCVFQSTALLPSGIAVQPGREKPWGTGHAVWCARDAIKEAFAVIGADDFFGRDAFAQLAKFLSAPPCSDNPNSTLQNPKYAMAGYRLANTLSEHGAVARGVCDVRADGTLARVTERTHLRREEVGAGREFTGDETVSMNCWAFTPEILSALERQLAEFLRTRGGEPKSEFYLPEAVSAQIAANQAEVRVLPTSATWFGVTYREDKPRVQSALAALHASGEYPAKLFNHL
jgi:NDP-sugar pyrophosphorylase family protein